MKHGENVDIKEYAYIYTHIHPCQRSKPDIAVEWLSRLFHNQEALKSEDPSFWLGYCVPSDPAHAHAAVIVLWRCHDYFTIWHCVNYAAQYHRCITQKSIIAEVIRNSGRMVPNHGVTMSTTNPTWSDLKPNPGRRGGKTGANRLTTMRLINFYI